MNKLDLIDNSNTEEINGSSIAIIGMSCSFPGAKNPDAFWQNLQNGIESISHFSEPELAASVEPSLLNHPNYVKANAMLSDIDLFDAEFFGFSPREAEIIDPQHRLFLEKSWETLENSGYNPETYQGSIGVYAGVSISTYLIKNLYGNQNLSESVTPYQLVLQNDKDFLSTRISYKLNLKGPSVNIQTACSTSLVAVHLACQSLLSGECDMSLAGGVAIRVPEKTGYLYQEGMILSPDGHCRAFDAQAQGTVSGNGVGVVLLKRLADAIADRDCIHAIIKGSAINNDGALKIGYTAPSFDGQVSVITEAQAISAVEAETISYIEAHGTGTPLGDPIEIAALTEAFHATTQKNHYCAIGSVKTNIGHLDAAAGVAGLIKTVLALKHKLIPPSLHFQQPNPKIDFANSPFYVNTKLTEWKTNGVPRRAGVSSFGIGGTNAHVILEEAPIQKSAEKFRPSQLLLLSAKTKSALETLTANLAKYLEQHPETNLADIAYTLQVGRKAFSHRRTLVASNVADAKIALSTLDPKRVLDASQDSLEPAVVFMFPGQGAQYVNMGWELYQEEPTFREQVDLCAEILKPLLGLDLRHVIYPVEPQAATQQLQQTAITQPALFVIEYSLAKLWMEWGVQPEAMIGHSIGEYVAACLAGVFSLEDALFLVAKRGELMQKMASGSMLAVPLSEKDIQPFLSENISLAAINGELNCVVAGTTEAVDVLQIHLLEKGVECRHLHTSHAFHSPMMNAILEPFTVVVKSINLQPPQIPYISNVTGDWITAAQATNPSYWAKHLRETIRFADGLQQLFKQSNRIFLEVGSGRTLSTLTVRHPDKPSNQIVLSSLRHPQDQQSDVAFLLSSLGKLWLAGVQVDWSGFYTHEQCSRLPLPTYPFERQRYWIDPPNPVEAVSPRPSMLEKKPDIADWFYVPSWKRSVIPARNTHVSLTQSCWLVFVDECGLGSQIVQQLEKDGQDVIRVFAGEEFSQQSDRSYTLNPQQRDHYDALIQQLLAQKKTPQHIVHLWSVTSNSYIGGITSLEESQYLGFYSLLFLTQAFGAQNFTDELQFNIVSNNIQEVTGVELLHPEKSTLLGLCKVIRQEYVNITCRSIDVVVPELGTWEYETLIDSLITEFTDNISETTIAYRGHHRWIQTFESVQLDKTANGKTRLREEGVYLITGGLGGIGLAIAEYLAKTVQAKLVLLGRSPLPEKANWEKWLATHDEQEQISRKIQKLQNIEALGGEILLISADVTNLQQMQQAIAQARKQFGQINGVIHAAGVPGGSIIQLKTPEMIASVMEPKVKGTLILETLFKDTKLDFLVLFSSLASIVGGLTQADYCAANAFLDTFALSRSSQQCTFTLSINWDGWQEVGMGVNTQLLIEKQTTSPEILKKGILPQEGINVFSSLLENRLHQVLISTSDFQLRLQESNKFKASLSSQFLQYANKLHPRPTLSNAYVAPRNELEQSIANIWQMFIGIEQIGIYDNFFDIGGDSLIAVQFISKLSSTLKIAISSHSLLNAPTIAELALLVEQTSLPMVDTSKFQTKSLSNLLVELKSGSFKQPFFLIHPVGGQVYFYRDLANCLDPRQAVYGLQAQGFDGKQQPLMRVEEMASQYIEALRVVQPEGPYFLGGSSFGGTVAFEMAHQLQALGQKVALLTLIDTPGQGQMPTKVEDSDIKILAYLLGVGANVSVSLDHLEQLTPSEQLSYLLAHEEIANKIPPDFTIDQLRPFLNLFRANAWAMQSYIPRIYPGKIVFFRALERDAFNPQNPELGWLDLATEGIEIVEVPGNHMTMHSLPHVQVLAQKLNIYLERARA
ncbi:SDR family NAD(P)-dependent oxidoreductase [Nostoc sp. UHCC 0302]|uniref:SDR family NAD(P)-dependent oxidoreductase n=1 Tax=Nostoc sp. UHCC 0302 TaxID=3134896 RepID=UPI00311C9914